ncbi:MAG TPA: hypothetical protein VGM29_17885 [Polyangiaceae bacterium]
MKTSLKVLGSVALAGFVFAVGCGSSTTSLPVGAGGGGGEAAVCVPGDTRACVGPAACVGGERCGSDGMWGVCDCGTGGVVIMGSGGSGGAPARAGAGGVGVGGTLALSGGSAGLGIAGVTISGGAPSGGAGAGGASGNGGAGTAGTTGSAGKAGSSGGSAGSAGTTPIGPLLDDLTDGDNTIAPLSGRVGYWYAYNDMTGTQWPPADPSGAIPFLVCPSSAVDCKLGPGHTAAPAADFWAETHGSGFTTWGAGIGFDLNDDGQKHPYDASAYSGISFWGKAEAATPVRAQIQIPAVSTVVNGGTCVPPADPSASGKCDNQYGINATFTTVWTQFMMPFATITQEDWGGEQFTPIGGFTKNAITDVQWIVPQGVVFDFAVDDITFY